MNNTQDIPKEAAGKEPAAPAAAWFNEALHLAREAQACAPGAAEPTPPEVRARIAQKVYAAELDELRAKHAGSSLLPLPFGKYLQALAHKATVELQPVLAAFGLPDVEHPTGQTAAAFAWFARALDFDFVQLRVQLSLSFAACRGFTEPFLAAQFRGKLDDPEQRAAAFQELEAQYADGDLDEWLRIQAVLRQVYREA